MKTGFVLLILSLLIATTISVATAQSRRSRATKEFMRDKLELSQQVLEGLATEDYDLIIAKSTKLSAMTQQADWRAFENPDYERFSADFRRQVDAVRKAAEKKNLDGATLAYVKMTMSCVECHKLVRGKKIAWRSIQEGLKFANKPPPFCSRSQREPKLASTRKQS